MYYVLKDHLGSITGLVSEDGTIPEEYSYDSWGRRRHPDTWKPFTTQELKNFKPIISRGYTGHEHLDIFGLINMNGRLYDPINGRMLSPDDNEIDDFAQSYNRYSYCRNNPLRYTDPSGWQIFGRGPGYEWDMYFEQQSRAILEANASYEFWDNLLSSIDYSNMKKYDYLVAAMNDYLESLKGGSSSNSGGGGGASSNSKGDPALQDYVEKLIWGDDAKTDGGNPNSPLDPSNPQNNTTDPGCQETDLGFFYQGSEEEMKGLQQCYSEETGKEIFVINTGNGYYFEPISGNAYNFDENCNLISVGYSTNTISSANLYNDMEKINGTWYLCVNGNYYEVYGFHHNHPGGGQPSFTDINTSQNFNNLPSYIWFSNGGGWLINSDGTLWFIYPSVDVRPGY
jgi:RHS repeat-associated protein